MGRDWDGCEDIGVQACKGHRDTRFGDTETWDMGWGDMGWGYGGWDMGFIAWGYGMQA